MVSETSSVGKGEESDSYAWKVKITNPDVRPGFLQSTYQHCIGAPISVDQNDMGTDELFFSPDAPKAKINITIPVAIPCRPDFADRFNLFDRSDHANVDD